MAGITPCGQDGRGLGRDTAWHPRARLSVRRDGHAPHAGGAGRCRGTVLRTGEGGGATMWAAEERAKTSTELQDSSQLLFRFTIGGSCGQAAWSAQRGTVCEGLSRTSNIQLWTQIRNREARNARVLPRRARGSWLGVAASHHSERERERERERESIVASYAACSILRVLTQQGATLVRYCNNKTERDWSECLSRCNTRDSALGRGSGACARRSEKGRKFGVRVA